MLVAIADTHATVWYLFSDPRLGKAASCFIEETTLNGDHIGVSAISIVEMIYLIEKGRIPPPLSMISARQSPTPNPCCVMCRSMRRSP
jgi:PIN domain nuclease of toxin-antitoxin system